MEAPPDRGRRIGRVVSSGFRPAWWLAGPHRQTLWPYLFRSRPRPAFRRERLELPDGDFLDLDWLEPGVPGQESRGVVLLLHGLEGSSRSHYVRGLSQTLSAAGYMVAVLHFRGCSGELNRLPRAYHSGETGDLARVAETLSRRFPGLPRAAVGFSLGGNALLKWLGENPRQTLLRTAVAVSVPFDLSRGADRLDSGLSRIYQQRLLASLRRSQRRKQARVDLPLEPAAVQQARNFREFDHRATAPLHGFRDAEEYYRLSSSSPWLRRIETDTLVLHARDDPFLPPGAIPGCRELGAGVVLEISAHGGHVGFVAGSRPFRPRFWLEERILSYLGERTV
ncbi:MAG: hydrolase [Pseudomonadota bacterium]|nr:hydrolase [Pseudomonadota bacterium]